RRRWTPGGRRPRITSASPQCLHLLRREPPPLARPQLPDLDGAEGATEEAPHRMTHRLEHPADLSVPPLLHLDPEPEDPRTDLSRDLHRNRMRHSVLELDALDELAEGLVGGQPLDVGAILL